jgi:hypothetical protein
MVTYIYFVKCPNCEDEHFDFFDDAKGYAMGCLSQKPIITQTEVNRNDFGECTDSTDLGTVWSWEDVVGKEVDAEPAVSVFTKDDLKNLDPGAVDPEFDDDDFYFDNNLVEEAATRISFKNNADREEFSKLCREIGIITGADLKQFMEENDANDGNLLDKLRAYRDELGTDFAIEESIDGTNQITELFGRAKPIKKADLAAIASSLEKVINKNGGHFRWVGPEIKEDKINIFFEDAPKGERYYKYLVLDALEEIGVSANTFDIAYHREQEMCDIYLSNLTKNKKESRKPIPEGMTLEELVEEMEENEDTVECTWCNELFDKSECRKEVDLGWLCGRCEAAIKSRGETLTFRENNYWDFLDEDAETPEKKTWLVFSGDSPIEIGEVYANTEEEAIAEAEREFPDLNYNEYDGAVLVVPADEEDLTEDLN